MKYLTTGNYSLSCCNGLILTDLHPKIHPAIWSEGQNSVHQHVMNYIQDRYEVFLNVSNSRRNIWASITGLNIFSPLFLTSKCKENFFDKKLNWNCKFQWNHNCMCVPSYMYIRRLIKWTKSQHMVHNNPTEMTRKLPLTGKMLQFLVRMM